MKDLRTFWADLRDNSIDELDTSSMILRCMVLYSNETGELFVGDTFKDVALKLLESSDKITVGKARTWLSVIEVGAEEQLQGQLGTAKLFWERSLRVEGSKGMNCFNMTIPTAVV